MEHSNGAVKTALDIQVDGKHGSGRPKMTWKQLTERHCREWELLAIDSHDRLVLSLTVKIRKSWDFLSFLSGSPANQFFYLLPKI